MREEGGEFPSTGMVLRKTIQGGGFGEVTVPLAIFFKNINWGFGFGSNWVSNSLSLKKTPLVFPPLHSIFFLYFFTPFLCCVYHIHTTIFGVPCPVHPFLKRKTQIVPPSSSSSSSLCYDTSGGGFFPRGSSSVLFENLVVLV